MKELTPLTVAVADDPYRYYENLVRARPLYFDEAIDMWVASSAQAVEAVLDNSDLRVRPLSAPVPKAIAGTPFGETFAKLARMNDGPRHDSLKETVASAVHRAHNAFRETADRCAERASAAVDHRDPQTLTKYMFELMPLTLAALLGLDETAVEPARRFARAMAPDADEAEIAAGADAVAILVAAVNAAAESPRRPQLLDALLHEGRRQGLDARAVIANAAGFFFQSFEASAGLIGNTLAALALGPPALTVSARHNRAALESVVAEVACNDSPVQNTRRFAACDTSLLGQRIGAGATVLAILAAANRDPNRSESKIYTFGSGLHACAGAQAGTVVACAGVAALLQRGFDPQAVTVAGYELAVNTRVPKFSARIPAHSRGQST